MNAEVISIGDELTSGQRLDTNSQWLSERLCELGIRVLYHTTVGDDLAANVRVFREAFDRADVIVCTGGLGPTADDLTRDAIAQATGTKLEMRDEVLDHIKSMFARRQRPMPERNIVQAEFPAGSRVIPNPNGTAPGIDMDIARDDRAGSRIFALPGVPAEMYEMWAATVGPALEQAIGSNRRVIRHRRIKCFGIGESDLEAMLPDLIRRGREPLVGITVNKATITLRITSTATTEQACLEGMQPTIETIHDCLGSLIFGEDDDELQHSVLRLLRQQDKTIAVAEQGTGGLIAKWLSDVEGESESFLGGIVSREGETAPLATNTAIEVNPIPDIKAISKSCMDHFGASIGLAVGPFPKRDMSEKVEIGVATPGGLFSKSVPFAGHPDILTARTAKHALNIVRIHLLGTGEP